MIGYGMKRTAQGLCLIDHATFNKHLSNIEFTRSRSLSLGDSYCDQNFAIKEPKEKSSRVYYEDASRADFDASREIRKLEERYDRYGVKLRK